MSRTFIIAEVGVNHGGSIATAISLVDAAVRGGADAVKFQSFLTKLTVRPDAPQADYQSRNAPCASQAEMLQPLELSPDAHIAISSYCASVGITFLSTAFDSSSLDLLLHIGVPRLKVASGELTNGPMLLRMARTGLPMIVSTGMATLDEVADALAIIAIGRSGAEDTPRAEIRANARKQIQAEPLLVGDVTLLHCTSSYPAPAKDANIRAMDTLAERFGLPVGYSDHTEGLSVSLAAVARGAAVIEKHLTIDRTLPGPDHAASLDPDEFAELVVGIRTIESALGDGEKLVAASEAGVRTVARRSLVVARPLDPARQIGPDDLIALRPGDGLPPSSIWDFVDRPPSRAYLAGELFDG